MCAGMLEGGWMARDRGEAVAPGFAEPDGARDPYLNGVGVGVPGVVNELARVVSVGDSNELMSIVGASSREAQCIPPLLAVQTEPYTLHFHALSPAQQSSERERWGDCDRPGVMRNECGEKESGRMEESVTRYFKRRRLEQAENAPVDRKPFRLNFPIAGACRR